MKSQRSNLLRRPFNKTRENERRLRQRARDALRRVPSYAHEIVAYIRRSCPFWAPETRIPKLYDIVSQYKTEAQDVIIEALRVLPLPEQQACGVDLLVKNAAA